VAGRRIRFMRRRQVGDHGAVLFAGPGLLYLLLLFLAPLAVVAGYSLVDATGTLTLDGYQRALDPLLIGVLLHSARLAAITTLFALLIGYPCALALHAMGPRTRALALALIVLPSWMNLLVRNYSWIVILRRDGVVNMLLQDAGITGGPLQLLFNDGAVLVGLLHTYLPFMILPLYAAVDRVDRALIEAARDLGAGAWATFRHVILPQTRAGALVGTILVFVPALGAFVTPDLLGGARSIMIANLIENQVLQVRDWHFAAALAMLLVVLVLAALVVLQRAARGRQSEALP
jgi:spermidine/putrescine transport system permease protein